MADSVPNWSRNYGPSGTRSTYSYPWNPLVAETLAGYAKDARDRRAARGYMRKATRFLGGLGAYYRKKSPRVRISRRRRIRRYTHGRGGFWGDLWGSAKNIGNAGLSLLPKDSLKAAGTFLGGVLGGSKGSHAGHALGGALSNFTGYGAYSGGAPGGPGNENVGDGAMPAMVNSGECNIIRHKEYIGDVLSGTGTPPVGGGTPANQSPSIFTITKFQVNPGLSATFPWLSGVAQQYQEYQPRGVIFEFKSTAADATIAQSLGLGALIMASDYNVLNPDFVNKQQMENTEMAGSCKPSQSMMHTIECDGKYNPLDKYYVRDSQIAATDLRFNDICNFYIASQGIPTGTNGAAVNIGELWVTYEFAFLKPIQPDVDGGGIISQHYSITPVAGNLPAAGTAAPAYVLPLMSNIQFSQQVNPAGVMAQGSGYWSSNYQTSPVGNWSIQNAAVGGVNVSSINIPNVPQNKKFCLIISTRTYEAKNDTVVPPSIVAVTGSGSGVVYDTLFSSAGATNTVAVIPDTYAFAGPGITAWADGSAANQANRCHTSMVLFDTLQAIGPQTVTATYSQMTLGTNASYNICTEIILTEINQSVGRNQIG